MVGWLSRCLVGQVGEWSVEKACWSVGHLLRVVSGLFLNLENKITW